MYADMQSKEAASAGGGDAGQAGAAGAQQGASTQAADDNIVDAEVKEVKKG
jgi:molecular chaperone DnaK